MNHTLSNIRSTLPRILAAGAIVLAGFSLSAHAVELKFKLSGGEEVPPVTTSATGSGTITVNPDMSVSGSVMTSGVAGTMAHIHMAKAGANGPVIIPLVKDGDNGWKVPEGAKLTEAQFQACKASELYVNVHSAEHKGGEIRAQLIPPAKPMSY